MKTKYIVFDGPYTDEMIIFGNTLEHMDVAIRMGVTNRVISAGFLSIFVNSEVEMNVSAYGESIGLDVKSRPDVDARIARRILNLDQKF